MTIQPGNAEFPEGLPVFFFYEDPRERRRRIVGAQPAPSSVVLPRLDDPGAPGLDYPLLRFPCEPWHAAAETQSGARSYASWVNDVATDRLATVVPLLAQAGAPVGAERGRARSGGAGQAERENPAMLAGLGGWMQRAFPALAAPMIEQGFLKDEPRYRLGWAYRARDPGSQGYSRHLDALVGSVAHDLAFIVADCARAVRPGLAWQPCFDTYRRRFVIGVDPGRPQADLIEEIAGFLTQAAARPRGGRGRELRSWYALTLLRGFERAAHGAAVPDVAEVFPDAQFVRGMLRRDISPPARPGIPARPAPPPAPEVVAALEAFRAAGWFETAKRTSERLAGAAQASWRCYEGEDLPLGAAGLYWRLLMLDSSRTWSDDVDAGVEPGDGIYSCLVDEVSGIRGKALGRLWGTEEDWASRPGDLLLSLRMKGGKKQLLIPSPGRYLSAAVFTGLNDLGTDGGPRLWFLDRGPPIAIVTRATAAERAALEGSTGLRLDPGPPPWWTSLAPLPERRHTEPPATPQTRPRGAWDSRAPRSQATRPKAGGGAAPGAGPQRAPTAQGRGRGGAVSGQGRSGHRSRAAGQITAQVVFDRLMRDLIAPALHELGFTGKGPRWFACRNGDYQGLFCTQKSRYSTREAVHFWVHLTAVHVPANSVYWISQLHGLLPGTERLSHWTVRADSPAEPVAEHLLRVFRSYGWPAIQAALDSPGYPPNPGVIWPRSFPPQPSPAALGAAGPNLGPLTWPLRRTGRPDDLLAGISDPDERTRAGAARDLGAMAGHDPDATAPLLGLLEHDPSPAVRSAAAHSLTPIAGQPHVRGAFQAAAADDEDVYVRWAARYALRLADLARQPGP